MKLQTSETTEKNRAYFLRGIGIKVGVAIFLIFALLTLNTGAPKFGPFSPHQIAFPSDEPMPTVNYPDYPRTGHYYIDFESHPWLQYRLPARYDLRSLAVTARKFGYYTNIDVMNAGGESVTNYTRYNEIHGTHLNDTIGYGENHLGYDLVITNPQTVTTFIGFLTVAYKVADDEMYIVTIFNTTYIGPPNSSQYISLDQEGRCDLSDQQLQARFMEILDNIRVTSSWINYAHFSEDQVFYITR